MALGLPLLPAAALAAGGPSPAPASTPDPIVQATNLDAIQVEGQRVTAPQSPKYTQPLVDTPATVTIVPSDLMHAQGVTTLRDALRNVPGISIQAGEGGVPAGDNLTLRGFSARTDLFVDGVRDIGGYSRDPFNIEQVEVAKGPASARTGRGSTGGSINLASKTARLGDFSHASASVGDNALLRGTADLNRAIGDNAAFRVNLMTHANEVNGRDAVESERWGVAPTIGFGLGTDTAVTLSLFHLEQQNVPDYGQPWVRDSHEILVESHDGRSPVDRANFYGLLDRDYEDTSADLATLVLEHRLTDTIDVRNLTRWGRSERDSIITAPRFVADDSLQVNRSGKTRLSEHTILLNATDLTADFETGGVAHALVAGVEFSREESSNLDRVVSSQPYTDLFAPDFRAPYTGGIERNPQRDADAEASSAAVYVFDTLTLAPQWELTGGLRWDRFEVEASGFDRDLDARGTWSRTDTELSGKAAVVFKPAANGSVYLAYGNSFNPSAEELELNASLAALEPEKSRTVELGTKWNLFGERLLLSSAVFRTEKTDARVDDPLDPGRAEVLDGEQRVQGFEVGAMGQVSDDWRVFGGYTYLDSEVTESTEAAVIGNALGNTPRHSASVWTSHDVTDALEVGFGIQHVGARWSNEDNARRAKAYTVYDMMVGYRVSDALGLRLNGYNLSDKDYVDQVGGGHYVPGAGRTFMLSADFTF
ncbi:MAG TPA: TonB-dependent siderophore receptor [Xanthomonadaceae bacterium]|nr:TonB-dependent siderophore receptor [Xanthomonadaceae bacterium]